MCLFGGEIGRMKNFGEKNKRENEFVYCLVGRRGKKTFV